MPLLAGALGAVALFFAGKSQPTQSGFFAAAHLAALALIVGYVKAGNDVLGVLAGGALFALGAGYVGAGAGRAFGCLKARRVTRPDLAFIAAAAVGALLLWAPWIAGYQRGMH